jgi:hypothetical protein
MLPVYPGLFGLIVAFATNTGISPDACTLVPSYSARLRRQTISIFSCYRLARWYL